RRSGDAFSLERTPPLAHLFPTLKRADQDSGRRNLGLGRLVGLQIRRLPGVDPPIAIFVHGGFKAGTLDLTPAVVRNVDLQFFVQEEGGGDEVVFEPELARDERRLGAKVELVLEYVTHA